MYPVYYICGKGIPNKTAILPLIEPQHHKKHIQSHYKDVIIVSFAHIESSIVKIMNISSYLVAEDKTSIQPSKTESDLQPSTQVEATVPSPSVTPSVSSTLTTGEILEATTQETTPDIETSPATTPPPSEYLCH